MSFAPTTIRVAVVLLVWFDSWTAILKAMLSVTRFAFATKGDLIETAQRIFARVFRCYQIDLVWELEHLDARYWFLRVLKSKVS
jgi:hypothetical protein